MGQKSGREETPTVWELLCISSGEELWLCQHTKFCDLLLQQRSKAWPLFRAETKPTVKALLSFDTRADC